MTAKNEDSNFNTRLDLLKRFCAFQERTKFDVKIKAGKTGMNVAETEKAIQLLEEQGFLDERRYAEAFVNGKLKYNQWGKIKIRVELRSKSVTQSFINECIEAIDPDEYMDVLRGIISKKGLTLQQSAHEVAFARLVRYAMSKGFEYELVLKAVNEFLKV
jgi:regulatory protein